MLLDNLENAKNVHKVDKTSALTSFLCNKCMFFYNWWLLMATNNKFLKKFTYTRFDLILRPSLLIELRTK